MVLCLSSGDDILSGYCIWLYKLGKRAVKLRFYEKGHKIV
jgi:hypothetical protein